MTIIAAADGSALGNPGPAGWAWYIDDSTWRAGGWPHGTNNMGELKAVLDLLEATAVDADEPLHVLCDSQYVINSVTKWMPGWKRKGWRKKDGKPVLNVDLLQAIDAALVGRSVEFEWVKGHAGHAMNEAADKRANAAATAFSRHQDPQVGPGYRGGGAVESRPAPSSVDAAERTDAPTTARTPGASGTSGAERVRGRGARASAADRGAPASGTDRGAPASGADLFSLFDELDPVEQAASAPADPAEAPFEQVVAREQALLTDAVRSDPPSAALLLHPAFTEIGASGRTYDRDEILAHLAPVGHDVEASDFVADELAPDVVLLRFTTRGGGRGTVHRTSVWVRDGGQWLLRHHQGTPAEVA